MVAEALEEYTEEEFDLSKCNVGVHPGLAGQPPPHAKPAGSLKSKTVAGKAAHETPPPTSQMEITPAGSSKSPSKCKTVKTVASKAKNFKNIVAKQKLSPSKSKQSQAEPHSTSQAGTSQAGPSQAKSHPTSQSGPSQADPNPALHTPSNPKITTGTGVHFPSVPPNGQQGHSCFGSKPTLYIRKW